MRGILWLCAALLIPAIAGCGMTTPRLVPGAVDGDIEIVGAGMAEWPEPGAAETANFVWVYETIAWRTGAEEPFHGMKTTLRCAYDPADLTVRSAWIDASGGGHAFRHFCVTPQPDNRLVIRIITFLDGRDEDLTVARFNGPDPTEWICEEYGVGPSGGFTEGVEIVFHEDGSWSAIPSRQAGLADKDLHLVRRMNASPDFADVHEQEMTVPGNRTVP